MASHRITFSFLILLLSSIINPSHQYENPRLSKAYTALQAWKQSITSDPNGFISNWNGLEVCNYTGIFCAPPPDDPTTITVAGIDLNAADIAGSLPEELGLLTDLAVFHVNSNRFSGPLPNGLRFMNLLFELDISNNHFSGPFPDVVLDLTSLKFLDLRFNAFQGDVPSRLFDLKLDAVFLNDNTFQFALPENLGNSPVSALVIANNDVKGSNIPASVANMKDTLNEIVISNSGLVGCLPNEIGDLINVTVFDVSFNNLVGSLPESMAEMRSLEVLNVRCNKFSGEIPAGVCSLPRMQNFTYACNCFSRGPQECVKWPENDDRKNCKPKRQCQRSALECRDMNTHPVDCSAFKFMS